MNFRNNNDTVNLNSLLLYELVDIPPLMVGLGNRKCPLSCLVGIRPAYSEQIAIVGENIGFRFKKEL